MNVIKSLDLDYLNAGLVKPRRGFTLVAGKELSLSQEIRCIHPGISHKEI